MRTELQSNEIRLAALTAPDGVGPQTAAAIESSIVASFVFSFRLMMWICAALALAGAAVAWRMIPGGVGLKLAQNSSMAKKRTGTGRHSIA